MSRIMRLLLIFLQIAASTLGHAAFENQASGARPTGMGQAFTAVADDANAILYNPAGLWQPLRPEITAHYGRLLTGLDDGSVLSQTMLGWAQPVHKLKGGIGAAYTDLNLAGLYSEKSFFLLGYSQTFMNRKLSLGISAKSLQVTVGQDLFTQNALDAQGNAQIGTVDPVLANRRSRTVSTFDVGALYKPNPKTSVGLAMQNVTKPDIGFAEENRVPLITRLGLAYQSADGLLALDYVQKQVLQGVTDSILSLGLEKPFELAGNNTMLARAGITNGSRSLRQLTFGFGWRGEKLQFDYSFLLPMAGLESSNNTHRLSVTYRFDWPFRVRVRAERVKTQAGKEKAASEAELKRAEEEKSKAAQEAERKAEQEKALQAEKEAQKAQEEPKAVESEEEKTKRAEEEFRKALEEERKRLEEEKLKLEEERKRLEAEKAAREAAEKAAREAAPKPKPAAAQTFAPEAPAEDKQELQKRFRERWNYYQLATDRGVGFEERLAILESMKGQFKGDKDATLKIEREIKILERTR